MLSACAQGFVAQPPLPVRAAVSRRGFATRHIRAVLVGEAPIEADARNQDLDPRFYDHRDLFMETLARTAPLAHRSILPRALTSGLISPSEQIVIAFVLTFLEEGRLTAPLLISGGYVHICASST